MNLVTKQAVRHCNHISPFAVSVHPEIISSELICSEGSRARGRLRQLESCLLCVLG